jgi:hypothetical protein
MKITLRNFYLGFRDQFPLRRLVRNAWQGHLKGFVHERSHLTHAGNPKIAYGSKESSLRACANMEAKNPGTVFRSYKCLYCDGFHIGKSRSPDLKHPDESKWSGI